MLMNVGRNCSAVKTSVTAHSLKHTSSILTGKEPELRTAVGWKLPGGGEARTRTHTRARMHEHARERTRTPTHTHTTRAHMHVPTCPRPHTPHTRTHAHTTRMHAHTHTTRVRRSRTHRACGQALTVLQDKSVTVEGNVCQVNLHRYNQAPLYPNFHSFGNDKLKKKCCSCISMYLFNMMHYPYTHTSILSLQWSVATQRKVYNVKYLKTEGQFLCNCTSFSCLFNVFIPQLLGTGVHIKRATYSHSDMHRAINECTTVQILQTFSHHYLC